MIDLWYNPHVLQTSKFMPDSPKMSVCTIFRNVLNDFSKSSSADIQTNAGERGIDTDAWIDGSTAVPIKIVSIETAGKGTDLRRSGRDALLGLTPVCPL